MIDTPGLHYNRRESQLFLGKIFKTNSRRITAARYWKDPHAFKPERFLGDWPRDAFLPFSAGE
jgi:Cytochrome P450